MWIKSLYTRLALLFTLLFLILAGVLIYISLNNLDNYQLEVRQRLNIDLASYIQSHNQLSSKGRVNNRTIKKLMNNLMHINPNIELYIIDTQGKILKHAAELGKIKRQRVSIHPIKQFLSRPGSLPVLGDDPRSKEQKKIFSVTPILAGKKTIAYLYIILRGEQYDTIAKKLENNIIFRLTLLVIVAGILVIFVSGLLVFYLITRRIRRLSECMSQFKDSKFSRHRPIAVGNKPGADEIDSLCSVFNELSDHAVKLLKKLGETDKNRRDLVTTICHDLRTPLTSLQGYVDTLMLKREQLSQQKIREYLDIISRHSKQITRLIDDLFELSKLDDYNRPIKTEWFSLPELTQDIVQNFLSRIEQKQLKIDFKVANSLSLIEADIGMIERAVINLLENAINYSDQGGRIMIVLRQNKQYLVLEITDTGPGISEQDLEKIFDKFYRSKQQQIRKISGSGLGLAICKRIIKLHQGKIIVKSQPAQSTTVTILLPRNRQKSVPPIRAQATA